MAANLGEQQHLAIVHDSLERESAQAVLPLLRAGDPCRIVAWRHGVAVRAAQFLAHVEQVAALLPEASAAFASDTMP